MRSHATVFCIEPDSEQADLAGLAVELAGELGCFVPLVDIRSDFGGDEIADHPPKELVVIGVDR